MSAPDQDLDVGALDLDAVVGRDADAGERVEVAADTVPAPADRGRIVRLGSFDIREREEHDRSPEVRDAHRGDQQNDARPIEEPFDDDHLGYETE
jgi:hypothetical protein